MSLRSAALSLLAFVFAAVVTVVLVTSDPQARAAPAAGRATSPEAAAPTALAPPPAAMPEAATISAEDGATGDSQAVPPGAQRQLPPVRLLGRSLDEVKASIRERERARAAAAGRLAEYDERTRADDARREQRRRERAARRAADWEQRAHAAELEAERERIRAARGQAPGEQRPPGSG